MLPVHSPNSLQKLWNFPHHLSIELLRVCTVLFLVCTAAILDVLWSRFDNRCQNLNVAPIIQCFRIVSIGTHCFSAGVQCRVSAADTGVHLWWLDSAYKGANVAPAAGRLSRQDYWPGNTGRWITAEICRWDGSIRSCGGCTGISALYFFPALLAPEAVSK